ncbi:hypothetical protein GCM10010484_46730 [Actinokineospora globicatena]
MVWVVPVGPERLAHVLTVERGAELASVEELVRVKGWGAELVAQLPVTPNAQGCGVVCRKR